jgi:hypothetical protein
MKSLRLACIGNTYAAREKKIKDCYAPMGTKECDQDYHIYSVGTVRKWIKKILKKSPRF